MNCFWGDMVTSMIMKIEKGCRVNIYVCCAVPFPLSNGKPSFPPGGRRRKHPERWRPPSTVAHYLMRVVQPGWHVDPRGGLCCRVFSSSKPSFGPGDPNARPRLPGRPSPRLPSTPENQYIKLHNFTLLYRKLGCP